MESERATSPDWPFAGLRVLDLSTGIAGPYCSKLLVDAGADVIKVESRAAGDPLRRWTASGSPIAPGQDGALFQFLNASKRSIALDVEAPEDREQLFELSARSDLVIESFPAGALEHLGMSFEAFQSRNPGLSLVSITPWGRTGPWALRPCTEFTLQAATGSTGYRGLPDRKPVAAGGRVGDFAAGIFASVGALSAWLSARYTGMGQHVDVSQFETMLLCMTVYHDLNSQWIEGPLARAVEIPSVEPAKDGWIGFCAVTGQQWTDFCAMIGRREVSENPAYLDGRLRMEHLDFMQEIIHSWTRERTVDEMVELATLFRIPVSPVGDGRTLPQMDHFIERGVFRKGPGGFLQPRPHYLSGKSILRPLGRAPALGEHAEEILAESAAAEPRQRATGGGPGLPLADIRVIDLTTFWAGPLASTYLASMGADVVKVESIQRPDGMRFAGARPGERLWEWSPVFHGANAGKRAITLQLDHDEGNALLKRLITSADLVIENYSPRVVENFGLGWETVRGLNPRAIMLRMPAFGLDGPWRDRTGFAMTIEQVSGLAWITGYEDLPLVLRGACDPLAAMHAVFAFLTALEHRRRTGEGQLVEVPLVEVALNVAAEQVIEFSAYGKLLSRAENRGPWAAPQGLYTCAAREYVALAIATDEQWEVLREFLGNPDWACDPSLATHQGRRSAHDRIDECLDAWFADKEVRRVVERLVEAGLPAAHVINAHHVHPNPQLAHREFFQTLDHPETGETRYPGFPMNFSRLGTRLHPRPAPLLGQHNDEVLVGELGLSEDELEELRQKKVIGNRPVFM